jgi:hypothetical protein
MNPFNLIFTYFLANSRAEHYGIKDPQEIQKTGLIAGMISANPIISYLLIENKAKELEVIPTRNPASTGTGTQGNTLPGGSATPTNTTDPVLIKLDELDKKLGENQKAIGELAKKVETIEKSSQENKTAIESINAKIAELPKIIERLDSLEKKVEAISNVKPATVTEVKPMTKK